MTSQVFSFWIVTRPTKVSTVGDICFMASAESLLVQGKGGLSPDEIFGMYLDGVEAETVAKDLIKMVKGEN